MSLADKFTQIVASLPEDWTDLDLDLRITDESRYIEAALILTRTNAHPYSTHNWHWYITIANRFGHGTSVPFVHSALKAFGEAKIAGELAVNEVRCGRAEVVHGWGRPESVREDYRRAYCQ